MGLQDRRVAEEQTEGEAMHKLTLIMSCLILVACGGGSSGDGPLPPPPPPTDTAVPVITLVGDNPQVITAGTPYTELGAMASDNVDGDITDSIIIDASAVDTGVAGSYQVTYDVQDAAGNPAATVTRTVTVENPPPPAAPNVALDVDLKKLIFSWDELPGATHYRLLENADGHSGFTQVGANIPAGTTSVTRVVPVHLFDFANALFIVEACNAVGCSGSTEINVMNAAIEAVGMIANPATPSGCSFGSQIALSADGQTMAVADPCEASNATGIDGNQYNNLAPGSGAVYILLYNDGQWSTQAYIKASNSDVDDFFGESIEISANGRMLAVSAWREDSDANGIDGEQSDNSAQNAGAVYLFRSDGVNWTQEAYIKASSSDPNDRFGGSMALSADGHTLAVTATGEDSSATGLNGDSSDNSAIDTGAAYIFRFDGATWTQQAYIKGDYWDPEGELGYGYGAGVALSADGDTLAVGRSVADDDCCWIQMYLYRYEVDEWMQEELLDSPNPGMVEVSSGFFVSPELDANGDLLAYGVEDLNGERGAVHMFRFSDDSWSYETLIESSNSDVEDFFGDELALSADGLALAVSAPRESSGATAVNGDQNDNSLANAGAVYIFQHDGLTWSQHTYVKPGAAREDGFFGRSVALSANGDVLVVDHWDGLYLY
jgi:hypothetical protein